MPPSIASPVPDPGRPPARAGISPRKTVLRGRVPEEGEYFAARAGDSPFPPGTVLPPGAAPSDVGLSEWVEERLLPLRGLPDEEVARRVAGYWGELDTLGLDAPESRCRLDQQEP